MGRALAKATVQRVEYPAMTEGQSYVLDFDESGVRYGQPRRVCRLCLGGRFGEAFQDRSSDSKQFTALAFEVQ